MTSRLHSSRRVEGDPRTWLANSRSMESDAIAKMLSTRAASAVLYVPPAPRPPPRTCTARRPRSSAPHHNHRCAHTTVCTMSVRARTATMPAERVDCLISSTRLVCARENNRVSSRERVCHRDSSRVLALRICGRCLTNRPVGSWDQSSMPRLAAAPFARWASRRQVVAKWIKTGRVLEPYERTKVRKAFFQYAEVLADILGFHGYLRLWVR
jgi:hypothetical protein